MAINLSPEEMKRIATALNSNCSELVNLARRIATNVNNALNGWEGAARKRYEDDFEKLRPSLEKDVPEQLTTMAQNLQSMANQFEELDNSFKS